MNRRTRRRFGHEESTFSEWVNKAPNAPVRRREFGPVFSTFIREYHDAQRPWRKTVRWLARFFIRPWWLVWQGLRGRPYVLKPRDFAFIVVHVAAISFAIDLIRRGAW